MARMHIRFDRNRIEAALRQASTTRQVLVEPGAMGLTGEVFPALLDARTAVVVADETTFGLAGEVVTASLEASGIAVQPPVILPNVPALHADYEHVAAVRSALANAPGGTIPVAVGSGTLNDLTKRAAFEIGVPYIVVGTAASMDGYTASGASLVKSGFKQTLPCDAPVAVVADPVLLVEAPAAMTAAGYGDLIGKIPAGADWLVADALGVEPLRPDIWAMVQDPLRAAIGDPDAVRRRDVAAVEQLFLGLVMTGLAIQATGSSRPASGSEHQFSHLWEMRGLETSHGFKVAFGTLWSTRIYESILAREARDIDWEGAVDRWPDLEAQEREVSAHIDDPAMVAQALVEVRAKYVPKEALRERLMTLRNQWAPLRERLRAQLIPSSELRDLLQRAGCPVTPEEIGLMPDQVRESMVAARLIRRRYTVLDLVLELGIRDEIVL